MATGKTWQKRTSRRELDEFAWTNGKNKEVGVVGAAGGPFLVHYNNNNGGVLLKIRRHVMMRRVFFHKHSSDYHKHVHMCCVKG